MITKDVKRRDRFRANSERLIKPADPDPLLRMCDGVSDAARKAERARIREWIEERLKRETYLIRPERAAGLRDVLQFLKEKE